MSENKKTIIFAVLAIILAAAVGCLFGDSVRVMLGTNQESALMSAFSDRLSVVKSMFAEQSEPYQTAAMNLCQDDGLELMASRDKTVYVRETDGSLTTASDYFSDNSDMIDALNTIFFSETNAVASAVDTNEESIQDVMLYNIKVVDDQVLFMLYYCEGGYIGIMYDAQDRIDTNPNIIRLSESNGQNFGWGVLTYLE